MKFVLSTSLSVTFGPTRCVEAQAMNCFPEFTYLVLHSPYAPLLIIPVIIFIVGLWKMKLPIFRDKDKI